MGASHSQAHQLQHSPGPPGGPRPHWAHSFPRDLRRSASQGDAGAGHGAAGLMGGPMGAMGPMGGRPLPEHCKVLPVPLGPSTRLHRTQNGDILHSGGTISGRRQAADDFKDGPGPATGLYRARSQSHHRERDRRHGGGYGPRGGYGGGGYTSGGEGGSAHGLQRGGPSQYGSEPDLRLPKDMRAPSSRSGGHHRDLRDDSPAKLRISRSRKKYKAPPPPAGTLGVDSSSPDSYQWERAAHGDDPRDHRDGRTPARRNRLFKTRAETKRTTQGGGGAPAGPPMGSLPMVLPHRGRGRESPSASPNARRRHPGQPAALQRSMSTPEFQAELLEVARKLRNNLPPGPVREGPVGEDHADAAKGPARHLPVVRGKSADAIHRVNGRGRARSEDSNRRGEGSGRESTPEPVNSKHSDDREGGSRSRPHRAANKHWEILPSPKAAAQERREVPARTFYFGMAEACDEGAGSTPGGGGGGGGPRERERDRDRRTAEVERFAAEIRRVPSTTANTTSGSASMSSEAEREDDGAGGIALQLRPTLPKKRLEIPRFSPTAAWRLLSSLDSPQGLPGGLYAAHADANGPAAGDGAADLDDAEHGDELEERIHRLARPTAPLPAVGHQAHQGGVGVGLGPARTAQGFGAAFGAGFGQGFGQGFGLAIPIGRGIGSHDKSGDSGISGDASPIGGNEDSSEAPCLQGLQGLQELQGLPRKTGPAAKSLVVAWTPQQDLEGDEESSSDGDLESPVSPHASRLGLGLGLGAHRGANHGPAKFSPRSHLFSLSLPRDNQLSQYSAAFGDGNKSWSALMPADEPAVSFHSLRNVRRSLGIGGRREAAGADEVDASGGGGGGGRPLDGNWLLSRSVPSSLNLQAPEAWRHSTGSPEGSPSSPDRERGDREADDGLFRDVLKQPSFSYLATGGHVMYLPDFSNSKRYGDSRERSRSAEMSRSRERERERDRSRHQDALAVTAGLLNGHRGSACAAGREMRELGGSAPPSPSQSPSPEQQKQQPQQQQRDRYQTDARKALDRKLRPKRFTFQSTLRQIERRRIAEKLSRDAELKEQQRLSELEAMRRVEEEFQRKRAREKANIRHQLRLFNLEEHDDSVAASSNAQSGSLGGPYSSLPVDWRDREHREDVTLGGGHAQHAQRHRAEPDGAPAPASPSSGKLAADLKASSGTGTPGTQVLSEYRQNQREYRDYRPSSCRILDTSDSLHSGSDLNGVKRATVHPEAVFDIPKNTPVYVANHHHNSTPVSVLVESERGVSTPRSSSSDNYRRDFAHGTVPLGGRSLASSDSELSQPNTRPTSRQGPGYYRPLPHLQRSRSASPQGNNSSCGSSPPLSRSGSMRSSSVPRSSPQNMEEVCQRPDSPDNRHPAQPMDLPSENKRQQSPERSPPLSRSTSPVQNGGSVASSACVEAFPNLTENSAGLENVEPNSPLIDSTSKPEVTTSTFLGLQPFGLNKNKGYRPISFNPPNSKLAQPVI